MFRWQRARRRPLGVKLEPRAFAFSGPDKIKKWVVERGTYQFWLEGRLAIFASREHRGAGQGRATL